MEILGWLTAAAFTVYALYSILILKGLQRRAAPPAEAAPLVSVVIAARNEAGVIEPLLQDLTQQDWPAENREIIVVDDGSTDGTAAIAGRYAGSGVRLLRIDDTPAGWAPKKFALSQGIAAAHGGIILTTDADCRVGPRWIAAMTGTFDAGTGLVAGFSRIDRTATAGSLLAGWEGVDFLALMTAAAGLMNTGIPMSASGQNLAYRRGAWTDASGFGAVKGRASGDDILLLQRIARKTAWTCRFCTESDSFASTRSCGSPAALLAQRRRWTSNVSAVRTLPPALLGYLGIVFLLSAGQLLLPVFLLSGAPVGAAAALLWSGKILLDGVIIAKGAEVFSCRDLLRRFPLWALTVPLYIIAVGLTGPLGRLTWKGRTL